MNISFAQKKELTEHWTSGTVGEEIKGDITDEDRKNPEIIVETRGDKELKRSLHGKEKAIAIFDEIMKDEIDVEKMSHMDKKTQILVVVSNVKSLERQREKQSLKDKLAELDVKAERAGDKAFNGKEILKRQL